VERGQHQELALGAAFAERLRAVDAAVRDADIENAPIRTLLAHGAPCLQDRCRLGHQDMFARVRDGLNVPLPEQGSGSITATRIFSRPPLTSCRGAEAAQGGARAATCPVDDRSPAAAIYDCRFPARKGGSRTFGTKVHYSLALKSATVKGAKDPGAWRCLRSAWPHGPWPVRLQRNRGAAVGHRQRSTAALDGPVRDVPPAGHCPLLLARWPIALAHCARPSLAPIALIHRSGASRWPVTLTRHAGRRRRPPCVPVRRPRRGVAIAAPVCEPRASNDLDAPG
jgi:hypothetical protein